MRSTFSILYYINRGKVKTDGTTAIMCRITIDGKSSVFTTGYYCNPECWNTKNGKRWQDKRSSCGPTGKA